MTNADYRNFVRTRREDDAVVTDSKARVTLPLSGERFYIAFTGISESSQRVQDSNSHLTVDATKL